MTHEKGLYVMLKEQKVPCSLNKRHFITFFNHSFFFFSFFVWSVVLFQSYTVPEQHK